MTELWPAIDIAGGRCVRLVRGDFARETVYGEPGAVASDYVRAGARRLHVVDLDAARTGTAHNRDIVVRIAAESGVPVQAGGGIRSFEAASNLLEAGVQRVVLGTAALEQPELVASLCGEWPGRVVVGLDHRRSGPGGDAVAEVALRGWRHGSGISLEDALAELADLELAAVVVTDISRDGTGEGPDLHGLSALLAATTLPVIASGGVGSLEDLRALAGLGHGDRRLAGAVVGTALVSGAIGLAEASRALGDCEPAARS